LSKPNCFSSSGDELRGQAAGAGVARPPRRRPARSRCRRPRWSRTRRPGPPSEPGSARWGRRGRTAPGRS
jgi:hypothetical protein